MTNRKSSPVANLIVGIAFIVGAWQINTHFSVPMAEEAKTSESWPTSTGVITYSDVNQTVDDGTTMYSAEINYQFNVENKSFTGNKISLASGGTSTSSLREIKKDLQKYPIGKEVTVYYDPELPNNAVLIPGANTYTKIIKYVPYVFGFFGILMLFQVVAKMAILIFALFIGRKKTSIK